MAKRKKAVVVISHNDHYYHLGDRTLKLEDGKLVPEDPAAGLLEDAAGEEKS